VIFLNFMDWAFCA